jgi:hypothetical protein
MYASIQEAWGVESLSPRSVQPSPKKVGPKIPKNETVREHLLRVYRTQGLPAMIEYLPPQALPKLCPVSAEMNQKKDDNKKDDSFKISIPKFDPETLLWVFGVLIVLMLVVKENPVEKISISAPW